MYSYIISGAVGPETSTLSVRQDDVERFTILLRGPKSGAALYSRDRLVLYLDRVTPRVWRLIQDGALRASIQEGGVCPVHRLTQDSLRKRFANLIRGRPPYGEPGFSGQARHIQVDTEHGRFQLCGPLDGWHLNVYAPSGAAAGKIRTLPDGFEVQVPGDQDPFLLLGVALYVIALIQQEEIQARQRSTPSSDIIVVQPGHPPEVPAPPFPGPPIPRRYPRRRWIDDPVKDAPRWIDDPLEEGRRWIDDPVDEQPPSAAQEAE